MSFVRNVTEEVSNQQLLYFPPHPTGASALPDKGKNTEIASFHSNAELLLC